jgi:hypothetical protein
MERLQTAGAVACGVRVAADAPAVAAKDMPATRNSADVAATNFVLSVTGRAPRVFLLPNGFFIKPPELRKVNDSPHDKTLAMRGVPSTIGEAFGIYKAMSMFSL